MWGRPSTCNESRSKQTHLGTSISGANLPWLCASPVVRHSQSTACPTCHLFYRLYKNKTQDKMRRRTFLHKVRGTLFYSNNKNTQMPSSEVFALILRKNYTTRVYEKSLRYLVKINDFIHCIADAKCCKKVSHPWEKWWNLILLLWLNAMSLQSSVACLIFLGADSQHFGYIPGKQQRWSQSSFYVAW